MISTVNSGLHYRQGINSYVATDGKTDLVTETRQYYMYITLVPDEGWSWPEEIILLAKTKEHIPITELPGFYIFLNGKRYYDDGDVRLKPDNWLEISVPIANDITSITLSPASFTYDGKEKKPQVVSARLINGDPVNSRMYKVTYVNKDNRMVSPVNPGTFMCCFRVQAFMGQDEKLLLLIKSPTP